MRYRLYRHFRSFLNVLYRITSSLYPYIFHQCLSFTPYNQPFSTHKSCLKMIYGLGIRNFAPTLASHLYV